MALNFMRGRMTKLPPGFRFQPTDEELVFHYLFGKIFSCPLPASVIPEIDMYSCAPCDLPGDSEQEKYFFCNKDSNGKNLHKAGYWKAMGMDRLFYSCTRNDLMGKKRTLVFHKGKSPKGTKTEWIMHEYSLASVETEACNSNTTGYQDSVIWMDNWVVCRIFRKKRNTKLDFDTVQACSEAGFKDAETNQQRYYTFMQHDTTNLSHVSSSSSSEFSCVSDITSHGSDYEATKFSW